jgi:hypothetical protein
MYGSEGTRVRGVGGTKLDAGVLSQLDDGHRPAEAGGAQYATLNAPEDIAECHEQPIVELSTVAFVAVAQ